MIDRLIYDNLDPLIALGAAAARTSRIELVSSVINVCWRNNPTLLAKQLWSLDRVAGGRLTAGLGMGGWPADYELSAVPLAGRRRRFDAALAEMSRFWELNGPPPKMLLGGTVPTSLARAATPPSHGWVAPLFDRSLLEAGGAAVGRAWSAAGRRGRPRIVTGRYFSLGPAGAATADEYIHHYYGDDFFAAARADTFTDPEGLRRELRALSQASCDDVILFPCSAEPEQVWLLAEALSGKPQLQADSALDRDARLFTVAQRGDRVGLGRDRVTGI